MKSIPSKFICVLAAVFVLAASGAWAQQPQPPSAPPQAPIVRKVEVQYAGPATVSKERVVANMRTAVGKPYSEQVVEDDIRSLYAMGSISNVRIFGEPVADGVKVVVVIQTKTKVGEIIINGVTKFKVKSLRKEFTTKPGETLTEANLEQDRQKILDQYQSHGYADTQVKFHTETNELTGATRVTFDVTEGAKTIIAAVYFEGNQVFKTKELRRVIKTGPQTILSFLTKKGHLETDQIDSDMTALREFYQNHGYVDVEVQEPRITRYPSGKVDVTFLIVEGGQYHVGNMSIEGATLFPTDDLRKRMKLKPGAVYSPKAMQEDKKAIQDMYGAHGYVDLAVTPQVISGGPGVIDLDFKLDEGVQSYIERVNIQGNTRTKDKVIRRELAVAPGEIYNTVKVDASKARLQNLNYFSKIDTYSSDTGIPGRKDLNVLVEEKRTGSFNFGAGFSSIDSVLGFAEIQQTNFDLFNWPHFTGGGERLRLRAQLGTERKDFIASLSEPWFLDYQIGVGGELFYHDATYISDYYAQRDYGVDLNARKALSNFLAVRLEYRLEDIGIYDLAVNSSPQLRAEQGSKLKSSLTAGITYDNRDSVFLTRKGRKIDFSAYVAGGPLGGNDKIYGFDLDGTQYISLPYDTILLFSGEVATVANWLGASDIPIFDRLFLGGANNLRGFKFRDVGPKDRNGEPLGGGTLARATAEYTFPIVERLRGAVFYDVGFVNGGSYNFDLGGVNSDVGVGVRVDLPIGPVRIDYGIPVQDDRFNKGSGKFNFNVGYQF